MDGVLIIDKPGSWTSHDVVLKARKILNEKRIGHTGTLDPMATGVLVLCIGKATRIARYLEVQEKEYEAVMKLGVTTDTMDSDGAVLETKAYSPPDHNDVLRVMQSFTGRIMQRPPEYSAVKIAGVAAYKHARRGEKIEIDPRPVVVHSLELLSFDDPFIGMRIICSKGLYVRRLCSDIGAVLEAGGHLVRLVRIRNGRFSLGQAVTLDQLKENVETGRLRNILISIDNALVELPSVQIGKSEALKVAKGNQISWRMPAHEHSPMRVHDQEGRLLAIARAEAEKLKPEVVFS